MKARDLMKTSDLFVSSETSTVQDVARMMAEHDVGSIPVLDNEGRLEGIVTDRDLCCRVIAQGLRYGTPITQVMTRKVQAVHPDASMEEIETIMREHRIRRLPVVDDDDKLHGWISFSDLARHCHGRREEHELVQVYSEICTPE